MSEPITKFENDRYYVDIVPYKKRYSKDVPKEHRFRYQVRVRNILITDADGEFFDEVRYVDDPAATCLCRTEEDAINAFNAFLLAHGAAKEDTISGVIKEVGNIHAPPPPPDLNIPTIVDDPARKHLFGSW
ncbi:hypothetical protein LJC19_07070 [Oxalobacter sp. OttesenSCG-928-P03]|nr:hypothetical protein [Oxalobacter sp. OttesenSCG-928-P03]